MTTLPMTLSQTTWRTCGEHRGGLLVHTRQASTSACVCAHTNPPSCLPFADLQSLLCCVRAVHVDSH